MMVWKMIFLFQGCILRFHLNLPGCTKHCPYFWGNYLFQSIVSATTACQYFFGGIRISHGNPNGNVEHHNVFKHTRHTNMVMRRLPQALTINHQMENHQFWVSMVDFRGVNYVNLMTKAVSENNETNVSEDGLFVWEDFNENRST